MHETTLRPDSGRKGPSAVGKRVAVLLPDLSGGGVERLSLLLAEEFHRRGYDVAFVLREARGELLAEVPSQTTVVDLHARRFRSMVLPLLRYLRRQRPPMLLSAMWPLSGLAAVAVRLSGVKCRVVVSEHNALSRTPAYRGPASLIHRRLGRTIYGLADAVVCVSNGVRDDLVALTGMRADRLHVIYNPVRGASSRPPAPEGSWRDWWQAEGARLIAVGTLKPQKDYPTLLRAFALLRQQNDARLLILGEGGARTELEALVAALGLRESVIMPGFVADPYPYLERADLFVLSSAWEGLGNVIIEALVCGTPVVSTDCPSGPAEILENGRYGRLVPVGEPAALAAAMAEALDAPVDHDMLRRRGAEFSVERAADRYLALLDPGGEALARR